VGLVVECKVAKLMIDLIGVMPPSMSTYGHHDFTHYGLYPLWNCLDLVQDADDAKSSPPIPTNPLSQNVTPPTATDLAAPASGSGGSRRETVRQGASAWTNVAGVAKKEATPTVSVKSSTSRRRSVTAEDVVAFQEAVVALNQKRTEVGHAGGIGTGRLPHDGRKDHIRRMMVVICGEGRDAAAISEVNR
jgi:hypothetical protein